MDDIESKHWAVAKSQGDSNIANSKNLIFSGRVYVYHEDSLTLEDAAALTEVFRENDASVLFRGPDHIMAVWSSIRAGDIKAPPVFQIKDGFPLSLNIVYGSIV